MIEIHDLKKEFKTHARGNTFLESFKSIFARKTKTVHALKGISFKVKEGEIIGFLGPNGAGKSTALKVLTGILYPTSGEVTCLGYVPWEERRKYVANIGAVFGQKSQLLWDVPPIDAFHLNKAIYSIPEETFNKNLKHMTELLGVTEIMKKPTRQLSLGERMKCEFIMAMLHNPKIVFLDEPTIGLDVIAKEKIREFIKSMNKKGTTFILTTHDLDDVEHLAERVIVINHGEIVFDDDMKKLKSHLGNKKQVHIVTEKPLPKKPIKGIKVTKPVSDHEMSMEIDRDVLPLNKFIKLINEKSKIMDMSIQELPIEKIIKQLYK